MNSRADSQNANRSQVWSLGDLVDFEVLFSQAEQANSSSSSPIPKADAALAAELQSGVRPDGASSLPRADLFHLWLDRARLEAFHHEPSPGEQVESALHWLTFALALCGFLLARGAVYSFFRAPESLGQRAEPINVFWFSVVCVGVPLLFTIGGFWWLLGVRAVPALPRPPAFMRGALLALLRPVLRRVSRSVSDLSGPEKRLSAQALWGAFRRRATDRKSAIGLRLSTMAQSFGLGFTAGILLFSWLDCLFYSRVFGWQSTQFSITAQGAYQLVHAIALPWAWLAGEGQGFPSLDQVAATRFVRFHDPGRFPADAAAAWANFLIGAALVYGFLPRVLLYALSRRELRQALRSPDFTQARFDRLWERLTKPQVQRRAPPEGVQQVLPKVERIRPGELEAGVKCVVILPDELNTPERREAILHWIRAEKLWTAAEVLPLSAELASLDQLLAAITRAQQQQAVTRAVFVQESFMPPVKGALKLLAQIKAAIPNGGVAVGLLGKPSRDPLGEPPSKTDFAVWEAKVLSLADSGMDIFSFRTPA